MLCLFKILVSREGRPRPVSRVVSRQNFNPLPSHEGRRNRKPRSPIRRIFQSTPLSRGGTSYTPDRLADTRTFQSTPLPRGETYVPTLEELRANISIHSPLTRGEDHPLPGIKLLCYFNPLPSHEGRRKNRQFPISPSQIHYAIFTITSSTDLKLS